MNEPVTLSDSQDRFLAQTTWDRNVVVIAGAGTGKTTILVSRMLNLLMREPQPLAITEIVALTFTNKAATEMKQRLRRELTKLAEQTDEPLCALFCARYQLSIGQVKERAEVALAQFEKAQIGTLHSFAAHLLRLHPLESGVDPSFQEDDGTRFNELFDSRWRVWLAEELGNEGRRHELWRRVLAGTSLEDMRSLAMMLAGDSVDLHELAIQCRPDSVDDSVRDWLIHLQAKAATLMAGRAKAKQQKAEKMLAAAMRCVALVLEQGAPGVVRLCDDDRTQLEKDFGKPTTGWDELDFAEAKAVVSVAQRLLSVDQSFVSDLLAILRPFLTGVQQSFLASGWVSFDGLLTRAKTLLRDYPSVRARIKHSYRAVLVDEFQDTDPVQYEIILYLVECLSSSKTAWQDLELEPGKLFIVGDPKQSIYAFRRADIEAFERVVEKIVAGGGIVHSLVTNFRSDASVLSVVNNLFDRLFIAEEHIQPSNERLSVPPQRKKELSVPGVQIRLVTTVSDEEEFDAAAATRAEAEQVACWIKEELLSGATVFDRNGKPGALQPGHIALIFRKLTQAQDYLDALRRYGIAYLTDGEKHFYRRQEIVDVVNLLRVLDNPHDRIALVGVLRSPLGGLEDRELLALHRLKALDITRPEALARWSHPQAKVVKILYERLAALHRVAPLRPVPEVFDLLFEQLPVLELAAASLHGEQAVANLLKARDMAEEMADRQYLSLTGFVDLMIERLEDQPDEAESALSEASLDAVRILTIHKAKGLEFPVVILPGLHQGARTPRQGPALLYDWSSRCYGVTVGPYRNLGSILVGSKMAAREEAEQRRLLYVGMTRARDLLMLSGGLVRKPGRDTVLALLHEAVGSGFFMEGEGDVNVAAGGMACTIIPAATAARRRFPKALSPLAAPSARPPLIDRYTVRRERRAEVRNLPRKVIPSLMKPAHPVGPEPRSRWKSGKDHARFIGICTHALLERWDFTRVTPPSETEIESICRFYIPPGADCLEIVRDDLTMIVDSFQSSEFYRRIQSAVILGREIPFVLPWGDGQIMEGAIDLMYRLDGKLWIADYKTDRISADEAPMRAQRYEPQATAYRAAVTRCLGVETASFEFVFLRPGVRVEM
jgi:ATP-dependent helicase/nuclease subunit A